jgi:hypothetical protein
MASQRWFPHGAEPDIHLRSQVLPPSPKIEFGFLCRPRNNYLCSLGITSLPYEGTARPGRAHCTKAISFCRGYAAAEFVNPAVCRCSKFRPLRSTASK